MAIETVTAAALKDWLSDGDEIALVDVREAGPFADGHPFLAVPIAYSAFETRISDLVPNAHVRLVLCDDGSGIADLAARRAEALGYARIFVLDGGAQAWQRAGYTLFSGVNVPSKTFGELIEETRVTPHISADQLNAMRAAGKDLVIVDGRTFSEFQRFAIPGGISCANGELALRIGDLAPDPATKIVVNCAGRTRSIIGAQTLIDLGVENPVVALENGTQGWVLAGHELEAGAMRRHSLALPHDIERRRARALNHAASRGVGLISAREVTDWLNDEARTTYLFDVRSDEEFEADGVPGFVHAPGGQLIQAADQWMAVRNARAVIADGELVRAPVVAAWLRGLGFEANVLAGGIAAAAEIEGAAQLRPALSELAEIDASELKRRLGAGGVVVLDLRSSADYRAGHIVQAGWSIRPMVRSSLPSPAKDVVLIADQPQLAWLAAIDLMEAGVSDIALLHGHPDDWAESGLEIIQTPELPPDSAAIDFVSFTHGRHDGNADASRQYLAWELGLIGQLDAPERAVFDIAEAEGKG